MPPRKGTRRWVPVPTPWEGVRLSGDGTRLFVVYVTADLEPADRADVRWDQERLTLTLSRMRDGDGGKMPAIYHCVEVPLSQDASQRILVDGATGERATAKQSHHLDPDLLQGTERTLDAVFEPTELLDPREITL
jgi:hypothetical protein